MDDQRQQFDRFIEAISPALEHADRVGPFGAYCMGVMLEGERKSVEPMAARLNPTNLRQTHQSLHHLISTSAWSDQAVLPDVPRVRTYPRNNGHVDRSSLLTQ
jgi:SRSO17 transposase